MPLYEFYCNKCAIVREALVPLKDYNERPECPKCKEKMEKYVNKVHLSTKRVTYGY